MTARFHLLVLVQHERREVLSAIAQNAANYNHLSMPLPRDLSTTSEAHIASLVAEQAVTQ